MLVIVDHGRSQTTSTLSMVILFCPWVRVNNSDETDFGVFVCSSEACQWSQGNDKQIIHIL